MEISDEQKIKSWIEKANLNGMEHSDFLSSFKKMSKQMEKMYNFIFGDEDTKDEGYILRTETRIKSLELFKDNANKLFYKIAGGVTVGITCGGTIVALIIKITTGN